MNLLSQHFQYALIEISSHNNTADYFKVKIKNWESATLKV